MDPEPKAKSKSVSLAPDLWEQIEAKASKEYGGNRSAYIRDLAKQNLSNDQGTGSLGEKDVLLKLAERYHPTITEELQHQLLISFTEKPINQAKVLMLFLDALHDALGDYFNPELKFKLLSKVEWEKLDPNDILSLAEIARKNMSPELRSAIAAQSQQLNEGTSSRVKKKTQSSGSHPGPAAPVPDSA